ncbi:haloacid dehalogenase [Vibrio sp. 10N.286.49.B3]|uniref:HAD family hydrolase n=1 Tax=Vibrio sp. 10N.286.49.B3 TaxID=1880855 RepID=UPI000C85F056|nr:HAD hydrolase-like protein [Vibrio sp. 10N.286.49.B3]PMH45931.1 haloacid dehalogenase [Vibrio sp. 10N.286.49.B3]
MQSIHNYDVYIFDCDGVILNSNQLKIDAMERALRALSFKDEEINQCVNYFSNNFGRSRFHHVDVFFNDFLPVEENKDTLKSKLLSLFSSQCKELYLNADVTPGFISLISSLNGNKYVASGSEQQELRDIFVQRGLDLYFKEIYGSPTPKNDLVRSILEAEKTTNAVMFGDAVSDFEASKINEIEFIGYLPYSNVRNKVIDLQLTYQFQIIDDFNEVHQ